MDAAGLRQGTAKSQEGILFSNLELGAWGLKPWDFQKMMLFFRHKFLTWFLPPILLAVLILFVVGCVPQGISVVARPLGNVGVWFSNLWEQRFPNPSKNSFCSTSKSELLSSLAIDMSEFESLKIENENLRSQLNFFERESFKYVSARIISRSASPLDSRFVIDRGADDGVKEGAAVIVAEGHMVGKVLIVSSKTAVVQTVLGRGARTAVSLFNSSRTLGISEGSGSTLLSLRFIPQNENIQVNNLIVTSGLEEQIPSGLIVGVVTGVERDPAAPFQEAVVEPLVDIKHFSNVSIIVIDTGGL